MKLTDLRSKAKALNLRGYSRMAKAELEEALTTRVVYREDRALVDLLGEQTLRACDVAEWMAKGQGRFRRQFPRAWRVPVGLLQGHSPLTKAEADALRNKRSAAGRKAAATFRGRVNEAADEIGALPGSRTARDFCGGHLDEHEARLRAFIAEYRHEHTDYDALLRGGCDKESARALKRAGRRPTTWEDYLEAYGFCGPVAEALARALKDPRKAHPVWFCEAMLAVERAGLGLDNLSYDAVRRAVDAWRGERG
jgi:hypothetical protein